MNSHPRLAATVVLLACFATTWSAPAAILVVTNQANNGNGTLSAILPTAQNGDVITFAVTGCITNVQSGGWVINHNISIVGPGPQALTLLRTNWYLGFVVNSGATASISGLTIYHCGGSGCNNSGNLTVSNCVFTNCYAANGGVVINNGSSGLPGSGGGAIYNGGILTAVNCQFYNNGAGAGGFGSPIPPYEIYSFNGYTTGGNGASGGSGGAVYDIGTASFLNCTFAGNTAGTGGSGGWGESGTGSYASGSHGINPGPGFTGGDGGNGGNGGAVFTANGAKFVNCTFFGNTAGPGGSGGPGGDAYLPSGAYIAYSGGKGGNAGNAGSGTIYCTGTCQIVACTFVRNNAANGGSGGNGGSGSADRSGNGGPGGSGGNAGFGGSGGAVYGPRGSGTNFFFQNVLTSGNNYGYAGPAGSAGSSSGSHLTGPAGTNGLGSVDGTGPDLSGCFISHGHNLVSLGDGSTGFTNNVRGDLVGSGSPIDAMVSDLADNHGAVMTCALPVNSPAVDAGDDGVLNSPTNLLTDARGYARKAGGHVDIGAFELQVAALPLEFSGAMTADGVQMFFTNTPGASFTVLGTTDPTLPVEYWDVLGTPNEIAPGQYQWVDTDSVNYDARFFRLRTP